ncbi:MAG: hypothetical protein M0P73_04715 [Syntrophobacterales bacterium]|jgi:hypothetical protein|nr:hypothetical protein [Syntrophobacterales bacterium]
MQEELTACRIDDEEVLAIHHAKLREITRALNDLFIIGRSTSLYSQSSTDMDYKDFEKLIGDTHEFSQGNTQSVFNKIDSVLREQTSDETVFVGLKMFNEDQKTKIIKLLLSLDYTPPQDWREIVNHLVFLRFYYSADFEYYHPVIEAYFDVSLCKLMAVIGSLSVIMKLDVNEIKRVKKLRESLKKQMDDRMTCVSQIFNTDIVRPGMKMHTVAIAIRKEFIERQKRGIINNVVKPPSVSSIKEYIKQDDILMTHFRKEGKFWIIKT